MNGAPVGAKRPAPEDRQYVPRKRPAADDDDIIEEDFDLEPPEDDVDEPMPDMEVGAGSGRPTQGNPSSCRGRCWWRLAATAW